MEVEVGEQVWRWSLRRERKWEESQKGGATIRGGFFNQTSRIRNGFVK